LPAVVFVSVTFLFLFSGSLPATVYYVDAARPDDSGTGTNWLTAKQTIQAAVELAADGDSVLVTNGIYDKGGAVVPGYSLTSRVYISKAIVLRSVGGPEETVIGGQPDPGATPYGPAAVRGIFMTGGCAVVGFTISNGYTRSGGWLDDRRGGGAWLTTNCVISNCVLTANAANTAGGIYLSYGGRILNCEVQGNIATNVGGGAYLSRGGMLTNCVVVGNAATNDGGGVMLSYGGVLQQCTLSDNVSGHSGGGAVLYRGGILNHCLVQENAADFSGGGVDVTREGSVNNCLVLGNTVRLYGGGVYLLLGGEVNNCTLSANAAGVYGGGAYISEAGTLNNCIAWSNRATSAGQDLYTELASDIRYTCASDGIVDGVDGCMTNDPKFMHPVRTNYHLGGESPCINAGANVYAPTNTSPHDLDGNDRIIGSVVEMGAYEMDYAFADAVNGNDGDSGRTWALARRSIQQAVSVIDDGGTVWVTNGLYTNGNMIMSGHSLTSRLWITAPITVRSVNGPGTTIIAGSPDTVGITPSNGPAAVRGVFMTNGCALIGFTVTNGYTMGCSGTNADSRGGGVWLATNCIVSNCVITGNSGHEGGGVCLHAGGALYNCELIGNGAYECGTDVLTEDGLGGGAYCFRGGRLFNCTLSGNNADGGAGVYFNEDGALNNCTLAGNSARGRAGGVFFFFGGEMNNSVLASNWAPRGGGVHLIDDGVLNNCLLNGNVARDSGGGVHCVNNGTLNNCTVTENVAGTNGGGISIMFDGVVNNCISWGNSASNTGNDLYLENPGADVRHTCASDGISHGVDNCITNNPLFLAGGVFQPDVESPCVNAGNNIYAPTNVTPCDLSGKQRIIASIVDMGAYEAHCAFADALFGDDGDNGGTWATAKQTIQAAIGVVTNGGLVLVTNGIYDAGGQAAPGYALTNRVCITKPVTVRSANGPETTSIVGKYGTWSGYDPDSVRCVFMTEGSRLIGFTITNGSTMALGETEVDECGGGVWLTLGCVVSNCIISGNQADRDGGGAYCFSGGELTDCIVKTNTAEGNGGGVYLYYVGIVSNTIFRDNKAGRGGGAYLENGGFVTHSSLKGNEAGLFGGGGYLSSGGLFDACLLERNSANDGGGLALFNGGVVSNCELRSNVAVYDGGGSYFFRGGKMNSCVFRSNTAGYDGGGCYFHEGGAAESCMLIGNRTERDGGGASFRDGGVLYNCSLVKNAAGEDGGGAHIYQDGTLNNCLLQNNGAASRGGGCFLDRTGLVVNCTLNGNEANTGGGTCQFLGGKLANCTVWGNTCTNAGNDISIIGYGDVYYTCASDGLTHGVNNCTTNDPLFLDEPAGNCYLQIGSPCIDAGDNALSLTNVSVSDLAGNARIQDGTVDLGAYEQQGSNAMVLYVSSEYGRTQPGVGVRTYSKATVLTNAVAGPDTRGTTQYVCGGWSMYGHSPAGGSTSSFAMTITNHATLSWLWSTNYWLETGAGAGGSVNVSDGWQPAGVTTQVTAVADVYYYFTNWSGDVGGGGNPVDVLMDSSRSIMAVFAPNLTTNTQTPEWWLASFGLTNFATDAEGDVDGDGMAAWEEYISDTIPTSKASRLTFNLVRGTGAQLRVVWIGGTGVLQYVEYAQNMTDPDGWQAVFTNSPPTAVTNQVQLDPGLGGVYRVRAVRASP
jgi:hypothetical protein